MRRLKRCSAFILAVILCFSMAGVVQAQGAHVELDAPDSATILTSGGGIGPLWTNTSSLQITLSINSGKASCAGVVIGQPGTTKITGSATLARYNSDGTLTNIKTWSDLSVDGDILLFGNTYYVSRGYTYRLTITATVYRNGTAETVSGSHDTYAS